MQCADDREIGSRERRSGDGKSARDRSGWQAELHRFVGTFVHARSLNQLQWNLLFTFEQIAFILER
jgi:hypothetical protein